MPRTHRFPAQFLRGLSALIAIIAILTVPPWALARFIGWPLPHAIPSIDDLTSSLRGPIPDTAIIDALACACWIAWALLTASLVTEIVTAATRRVATAVPLAGFVQPLARQLVVSATLLIGVARPAVAAPKPESAPITRPVEPDAPETPAAPEIPKRTCIVAPRDSLWRLAERHLGNGLRWREIWDLNRDRTMTGGRTFHNPNIIRPGWELLLPAPPDGAQPNPRPVTAPAEEPDPPDPSDPPDPAPPPSAQAAPTPTTPTTVPTKTTVPPAAASPATTPTTAPVVTTASSATVPTTNDGTDDPNPVPLVLAGATLVAAGVVGTLHHLRRRQQRHRTPGHTILTPKAAAAKAERQLRTAANTEGADRLDLALRTLGGLLAGRPDADDTRIEVVQVDGTAIEILLTQPVNAEPGPFKAVGGRLWRLPAEVPTDDLARQAADRGCLTPALVSIGHRNGTQVLIDLEHPDPLLLEGDNTETARILTSLTLDLATNTWADDVRLLVHGHLPDSLTNLDRVEQVHDLDQLPDLLRPTTAAAGALGQLGYASTWAGRLANSGEGWPPTVLLLGPDTDPAKVPDLLAKVGTLPGLAVVATILQETNLLVSRRLQVKPDGRSTLQPLGLDLDGTGINQELLEATAELLGVAQSLEPGDSLDLNEEVVASDRPAPRDTETTAKTVVPGGPNDPDRIIVRVLGPVEIEGGARPVTRRKCRELIVLLALHPKGRTEAQIKDALWPDQLPTANTFNQTVSRARTALGANTAEKLHIPHVTDGHYRISRHVVTDADLLEQTLSQAVADPSDQFLLFELTSQLADAKAPFEGSKGYEWAYEKALPARMSAILDEARMFVDEHRGRRTAEEQARTGADS